MLISWASQQPAFRLSPAPSSLTVLTSGGSSYSAPLAVLSSAGASNTVTTSVRAADGTAYVVI